MNLNLDKIYLSKFFKWESISLISMSLLYILLYILIDHTYEFVISSFKNDCTHINIPTFLCSMVTFNAWINTKHYCCLLTSQVPLFNASHKLRLNLLKHCFYSNTPCSRIINGPWLALQWEKTTDAGIRWVLQCLYNNKPSPL